MRAPVHPSGRTGRPAASGRARGAVRRSPVAGSGAGPRQGPLRRPLAVVFLPAYNEAEAIGDVIRRIPRPAWPGWETLVLVLDDGSTDGTAQVARAAGADLVVRHPCNRGLGYTVRQALRLAYRLGAGAAVMIDADGEYPPEAIPDVLAPIMAGEADYVLGSRFRGRIRGMRWYRRLGNHAFTLLQALILRRWISDGQTGLRAFSRPVLRRCRIVHDYNYAQVMNLNLLRQGFRLAEVPIAYRFRATGQSFIRFRDYARRVLPAMVRELLLPVERRVTPEPVACRAQGPTPARAGRPSLQEGHAAQDGHAAEGGASAGAPPAVDLAPRGGRPAARWSTGAPRGVHPAARRSTGARPGGVQPAGVRSAGTPAQQGAASRPTWAAP